MIFRGSYIDQRYSLDHRCFRGFYGHLHRRAALCRRPDDVHNGLLQRCLAGVFLSRERWRIISAYLRLFHAFSNDHLFVDDFRWVQRTLPGLVRCRRCTLPKSSSYHLSSYGFWTCSTSFLQLCASLIFITTLYAYSSSLFQHIKLFLGINI